MKFRTAVKKFGAQVKQYGVAPVIGSALMLSPMANADMVADATTALTDTKGDAETIVGLVLLVILVSVAASVIYGLVKKA